MNHCIYFSVCPKHVHMPIDSVITVKCTWVQQTFRSVIIHEQADYERQQPIQRPISGGGGGGSHNDLNGLELSVMEETEKLWHMYDIKAKP